MFVATNMPVERVSSAINKLSLSDFLYGTAVSMLLYLFRFLFIFLVGVGVYIFLKFS